jgi:hypothetical protein
MTNITVDLVETDGASGGHAALRITGLTALPPDPTFRIDPIDDALSEAGEVDWPTGPRRPQSVIALNGAFDLVLGPDVLDSPMLLPGTPVVISVSDTSIVKEMVWPSIPTRKRRARRPVIVTDELREAERTAHEAKRRDAAATLAAATSRAAEHDAQFAAGGSSRWSRPSAARSGTTNPRLVVNNPSGSDPFSLADGDRANGLSGFSLPPAGPTAGPSRLVPKDGRSAPVPALAGSTAVATVAPVVAAKSGFGRQVAAFLGGMAAAAVLVFGMVQYKMLHWQPTAGSPAALVMAPDTALAAARNTGSLRAVLATGGVSPRGKVAATVDGPQALALSDKFLHGAEDAPRDQGEASFWLRHALSQALDQDGMRWALTQLGSIFASPEGFEPDFAKARMLWEVAGGLGDPVALCFNAALYEHGLGVPRHKDLARVLYERARSNGGCRGVDDAIARTR